jgi:TPP-dependent pyruvate/acetoin dehydrogenase alpha subunit
MYWKMYLIRRTEETIEKLFSQGVLRGTTHGCKGQEVVPVAILDHISLDLDYVTGNHRSHGDYLALTEDVYGLLAELMGLEDGIVQGMGGSQHLRYKNFYTNGITGGMVPVAVGLAFSQLKLTQDGIVVALFGDGAMNEGYVLEALNLAAVFSLPILFVLANNHYAMSTAIDHVTRRPLYVRAEAMGLESYHLEALDVGELWSLSGSLIEKMRQDRIPRFIEIKTFRFSGHSKSDKREYIPSEEDEYWHAHDPLIKARNALSNEFIKECESRAEAKIKEAIEKIEKESK